jgi:hypothetical protein
MYTCIYFRAYFCIDGLIYHNQILTILWDSTGTRYNKGIGFIVFINGVKAASTGRLRKLKIKFSQFKKH